MLNVTYMFFVFVLRRWVGRADFPKALTSMHVMSSSHRKTFLSRFLWDGSDDAAIAGTINFYLDGLLAQRETHNMKNQGTQFSLTFTHNLSIMIGPTSGSCTALIDP